MNMPLIFYGFINVVVVVVVAAAAASFVAIEVRFSANAADAAFEECL
jgi:hypothetical protein